MSHLQRGNSGFLHQIIVDARAGDETALHQIAEYLLSKAFEMARCRMQAPAEPWRRQLGRVCGFLLQNFIQYPGPGVFFAILLVNADSQSGA